MYSYSISRIREGWALAPKDSQSLARRLKNVPKEPVGLLYIRVHSAWSSSSCWFDVWLQRKSTRRWKDSQAVDASIQVKARLASEWDHNLQITIRTSPSSCMRELWCGGRERYWIEIFSLWRRDHLEILNTTLGRVSKPRSDNMKFAKLLHVKFRIWKIRFVIKILILNILKFGNRLWHCWILWSHLIHDRLLEMFSTTVNDSHVQWYPWPQCIGGWNTRFLAWGIHSIWRAFKNWTITS